jgi:PHD/YefM family antitoxin component YafN of YafNO toxin-antitoxin module
VIAGAQYVRRNRRDAVVITQRGKPVSALLPLEPGADLERLALSMNQRFRAILERSRAEIRAGRVVSSDEVRRIFGLKRKVG